MVGIKANQLIERLSGAVAGPYSQEFVCNAKRDIETFAYELDRLDGEGDGEISLCPAVFALPGDSNLSNEIIEQSASSYLTSLQEPLRRKIIEMTKNVLMRSPFCTSTFRITAHEEPGPKKAVVEMRSRVLTLRQKVISAAREYSLDELFGEMEKRAGIQIDPSIKGNVKALVQIYRQRGFEGLMEHLRALKEGHSIDLAYLFTQIKFYMPIQIRMDFDQHYLRRVGLKRQFGCLQKYAWEIDPIKRWQEGCDERRGVNQTSDLYSRIVFGVIRFILPEMDFSDVFERSALMTHKGSYKFGDPESVALLIEGIERWTHQNPSKAFLSSDADSVSSVEYEGYGYSAKADVTSLHGVKISEEGSKWLRGVLSATHQIMPSTKYLQNVEIVSAPGPQFYLAARNPSLTRGQLKTPTLNLGPNEAIGLEDFVGALFHEEGHHYDEIMIERTWQLESADYALLLLKDLIYRESLVADAALLVADANYNDGPLEVGHPFETSGEFFASSYAAFTWNADRFARNIQMAVTIESKSRIYGIKVWCFLRDYVFHGVVFTTSGYDPFANYTISRRGELKKKEESF